MLGGFNGSDGMETPEEVGMWETLGKRSWDLEMVMAFWHVVAVSGCTLKRVELPCLWYNESW